MGSYRFNSNDREYNTYKVMDMQSNETVEIPNFSPTDSKLFDGDLFEITEGKFILKESPLRANMNIPGVLVLAGARTYGRHRDKLLYKCVPYNTKLPVFLVGVRVRPTFHKYLCNRYVLMKFKHWHENHPHAVLEHTLGRTDNSAAFEQYMLQCGGLSSSYKVLRKAVLESMGSDPLDKDVEELATKHGAEDRRQEEIITIDPKGSMDLDDGFSLKQYPDQDLALSVYIANVPFWMNTLKLWDKLSDRRATVYFPRSRYSMLPPILSEKLCSLHEKKSRVAIAFDFRIAYNRDNATLLGVRNTLIRIKKNFTYNDAEAKSKTNGLCELSLTLVKRLNRHSAYLERIDDMHDVVAYLMIMVNHAVARILAKQKTGIFRSMRYLAKGIPKGELGKFMQGWESGGSTYSLYDARGPHMGIGVSEYTHTTSPIRRYVDLVNLLCLQRYYKLINLEQEAECFLQRELNAANIAKLNDTMRRVKWVQNSTRRLAMFSGQQSETLLNQTHRGFLIEQVDIKDRKRYRIYLPDLRIVSSVDTDQDLELFTLHEFVACLFLDEARLVRKVRFSFVRGHTRSQAQRIENNPCD